MPDIEKVINGLERCEKKDCVLCPYKDEKDETYSGFCEQVLKQDALDLLKEQEAEISKISNAYLDLVGKASKQPVVVRCKYCKWGEPTKNAYGEDRIICGNDDTYIDRYITVPADWFCADGERKEEEE